MNIVNNLIQTTIRNALSTLGPDCENPSAMVVIGNGKTGKSVENRIAKLEDNKLQGGCPLMKAIDGHVTSPKCPSCYAVALINNYPGLRAKLMETHSVYDIIGLAAHAHPIIKKRCDSDPVYPGDRLRIYGVTDFAPNNMPALRMLARVYQLDIISKTLWLSPFNRQYLVELARMPNVNISLSFNKKIPNWRDRLKGMVQFIRENKIGHSVGINYTFTTDYRETGRSTMEPIESIEGVGVYHIVSKDKHKISRAIGDDSKVCGIFSAEGKRLETFGKGKEKGSCIGCNFCRHNVLDNVLPLAAMLAAGE